MKMLINKKWQNGFLDYYCGPNDFRVVVKYWKDLEKLKGLYFEKPKSCGLVWNYLKEIGFSSVFRKIMSRLQENSRNEKYIACGAGIVLESPNESKFKKGDAVAFLSYLSPCAERIVLSDDLIFILNETTLLLSNDFISHTPLSARKTSIENVFWKEIKGWHPFSGVEISKIITPNLEENVLKEIKNTDWQKARKLSCAPKSSVKEKDTDVKKIKTKRKRAALFGYGHYAKVNIIPNIKKYISLSYVHEIDPAQIPESRDKAIQWDTSSFPRKEEKCDASFIAGFHHTHASLAIYALKNGQNAVVEKPLAVSEEQLQELLQAMQNSKAQLFSCFHKRYLPFNNFIFKDLGIKKGEPFDYHCIVYEVPVPEMHWYNWPNSHSRLLADGCHWLDHFLFLNDFKKPISSDVFVSFLGTSNCSVLLENGSFFTMVFTTVGSSRIGVQDYQELRKGDTTIKMINGSEYIAENKSKILRKAKINKMLSYKIMYNEISRKIFNNEEGDSCESVEVSSQLSLSLEKKLFDATSKKV